MDAANRELLDPETAKALAELEDLARLLDSKWRIPGTSIRFGVDVLAGIVPIVGDLAAGLVSAWMVVRAAGHRIPAGMIARMLVNVVIDTGVGAIPIAGLVFDLFYRSNDYNVGMLRDHLVDRAGRR